MGAKRQAAPRARIVARISALGATAVLCVALSACGGRVANPVPERTALDDKLSCRHVIAEKRKLKKRVADLKQERKANRRRSLSRVPSAVVSGNPFSAIFFADPSVAIYKEIKAADRRQRVLDELLRKKGCIAPAAAASANAPAPVKEVAAPVEKPPVEAAAVDAATKAPAQPEPPSDSGPVEAAAAQATPPAEVELTAEAPAQGTPPAE